MQKISGFLPPIIGIVMWTKHELSPAFQLWRVHISETFDFKNAKWKDLSGIHVLILPTKTKWKCSISSISYTLFN